MLFIMGGYVVHPIDRSMIEANTARARIFDFTASSAVIGECRQFTRNACVSRG
jgi:hypothetical protein